PARPGGRGETVAHAPGRGGRDALKGPEELRRLLREDPTLARLRGRDAHGGRDRGDRRGVQQGHLRPLQGRRLLEPRDDEAGAPGLPAPDGASLPAGRGGRGRRWGTF